MKRTLGFSLLTLILALSLWQAATGQALNYLTSTMLRTKNWTFTALQTFTGGVGTPLKFGVNYTMADPTAAPTGVVLAGAIGQCLSASQPYRFYRAWVNEAGVTLTGPASADVTGFAAGGPGTKATVSWSGSPPANAKGQLVYWSRAGGGESHSILRLCNSGGSATTFEQGFISSGSTTMTCSCTTTQMVHPGSNQTGLKAHTSVNAVAQGIIGEATFAGGQINLISENARRLDISGTNIRFSSDGGATYSDITLDRVPGGGAPVSGATPQIVNVCPVGCTYSTLDAACTARAGSSDSTHPIYFYVGPGVYTAPANCTGLLYGGVYGAGPQFTRFEMANASDVAINFGTLGVNLTVAHLKVQGATGINFGNGSTNMVAATVDDVWADISNATGFPSGIYLADPADNAVVTIKNSRLTMGRAPGTGWQVNKSNGLISIYSQDNIHGFNDSGTHINNGQQFWYLGATPKLFVSVGDVFTGSVLNRGPVGYYFGSGSGAGASNSRAYISGMMFDVVSTENDNTFAPPGPVCIQVNSGATNLAQLVVTNSVCIGDSPNANAGSSADGVGIYILNATTKAYIFGTFLRNTAAYASGLVYDLYGTTTAGNLVVGPDSDWLVDNGILVGGRGLYRQGASNITAAATITLPPIGDFFVVTGNTNITSVTASWAGRIATIEFTGTPTFTDGSNLKLNGNLVATADDTITIRSDGTNWFEVARSVN